LKTWALLVIHSN